LTSGISKFPSRPQSICGNSGILTATTQFQYLPECTIQAAGVPGAVRECLIGPAHCSCTKARKVPRRPSSLLLQYRQEHNVNSFWDCQVVWWGEAVPPQRLGMNSNENDGGLYISFQENLQKSLIFLWDLRGLTHVIDIFTWYHSWKWHQES